MPFIQQVISPVKLSRPDPSNPKYQRNDISGDEFGFIANYTLSNVLRQLASVLLVADGIFQDLNIQLNSIRQRTDKVKQQIEDVDKTLEEYDLEVLPDNRDRLSIDLLSIKTSYAPKRTLSTCLFTKETRSINLEKLYETATLQVPNIKETYDMPICTPVLGQSRHRIRKHIDEEIDTRMPETVRDLRKWTSTEAIGDITVRPDCISMVEFNNMNNRSLCNDTLYASFSTSYIDGIDVTIVNDEVDFNDDIPLDHTLPSPEEQCKTIAKKYPPNFVEVDTSRGRFERMALIRRTIGSTPTAAQKALHDRFPTVKIRTKPKRSAGKRRNTISGIDGADLKDEPEAIQFDRAASVRQTTDFSFRSSMRFTQLKALKQWGKHRLKITSSRDSKTDPENEKPNTSTKNIPQGGKQQKKKSSDKSLKQDPLYLSSENTFGNYFLPEKSLFTATDMGQVKMREALTRRCRRSKAQGQRVEELNSSSGNWSASSESGRTSASSENTVHPKPHHLSDGSTQFKRKFIDTSTPSRNGSVDLNRNGGSPIVHRDMYDDENSSIYSCDTEGYFTSFHLDSGLKNMKNDHIDCEYGLFGKLSKKDRDSETASDDTLVHIDLDYELALFKEQLKNDNQMSENALEAQLQYSNTAEFQLMDQESPFHEKTAINSSRIPSMSEITPLNSDEDEQIVLEGLLQTLNCKPMEALSGKGKQSTDNFIQANGKPLPLAYKKSPKPPVRQKEKEIINSVTKLHQNNIHSKSFHDVSNLPTENVVKKRTKYWTMPLIKKKPYLKSLKLFDEVDSGPRKSTLKQPEIVPSKKSEKILSKPVLVQTVPVINREVNTSCSVKPMKSFFNLSSNNFKENISQSKIESKIAPKTTLMDFKKLLLSTAGKKNYERQSAAELLKVAKEPQFPIPIQDMSYSPRALSNRRVIRQKLPSPVKKSNVMSPRSKWKYKNFGTNVITAIPEVSNEEENASVSSQDAVHCIQTVESAGMEEVDPAEDCSLKNNIFLQEEENNFMRGEIKKYLPGKIIHNIQNSDLIGGMGKLNVSAISTDDNTEGLPLETSF